MRRLGVLVVALVTGCTSSVAGPGRYDGPGGGPSPAPSGRAELTCSGGTVISPRGAPYCFILPRGFRDVTDDLSIQTSTGGAGTNRAAVGITNDDLILAVDFPLDIDTDTMSDDALRQQLTGVIAKFEQHGLIFASREPEQSTVDNARTFHYSGRSSTADLHSEFYFVVRGTHEIELNCQYAQRATDVLRGCQQVLDTLQVMSAGP